MTRKELDELMLKSNSISDSSKGHETEASYIGLQASSLVSLAEQLGKTVGKTAELMQVANDFSFSQTAKLENIKSVDLANKELAAIKREDILSNNSYVK